MSSHRPQHVVPLIVACVLAGTVSFTRAGAGASAPPSLAEYRGLARAAAETPGPWRQIPFGAPNGPALGSPLESLARANAPHRALSPALDAPAASGPDLWQPGFGLPSLNEYPSVAVEFRGELVVSGWLRSAGGAKVAGIARWDGSSWRPLGQGVPPAFALAVLGDRLLAGSYLGGISSWDGAAWTKLPVLPFPMLSTLLVKDEQLYAAGNQFSGAGAVARFDGDHWTTLGAGFDQDVDRLGAFAGELIAGGEFESSGGDTCRFVARWDGTAWRALGAGLDASEYGAVYALQEFDGRLVVGGRFTGASGEQAFGLAAWDGSAWHALPGEPSGLVYDLFVAEQKLWVAGYLYGPGGYSSVKAFDGSGWDASLEPLNAWALGLTHWDGHLVAVGGFDAAGPEETHEVTSVAVLGPSGWTGLERWDDLQKGLAHNAGAASVEHAVVYRGELVVAGMIRLAGSATGWKPLRGIARWDGHDWQPLGAGLSCGLGALSVVGSDLIVVGNVSGNTPEGPLEGAGRWDGVAWHPLGRIGAGLVESVCEYAGRIYAGGEDLLVPGGARTTLAVWDGVDWRAVPGAPVAARQNTPRVYALLVHGGRLVAGGNFSGAGTVASDGLATWDGSDWHTLGGGPGSTVQALALHAGTLYAGGMMADPVGYGADGLRRWTGAAWVGLGLVSTQVTALVEYDSRLVVAGAGGVDRFVPGSLGIVAWDGERWSGFAAGIAGIARALCQLGGDLVVTGDFDHAGAVPAYSIARWAGGAAAPGPGPGPAEVAGLALAGTLFTGDAATIRYRVPAAGRARLELYDLRGARVATLLDRAVAAGDGELVWRPGSPAQIPPQGVYFLRLRLADRESRARFVIAR